MPVLFGRATIGTIKTRPRLLAYQQFSINIPRWLLAAVEALYDMLGCGRKDRRWTMVSPPGHGIIMRDHRKVFYHCGAALRLLLASRQKHRADFCATTAMHSRGSTTGLRRNRADVVQAGIYYIPRGTSTW